MSKLAKRLVTLVLTATVTLSSGCGTIWQGGTAKGPAMFGGVRLDLQEFSHPEATIGDLIGFGFDLPLSLAGDCCMMALLFFPVWNELYEGGIDVQSMRPPVLDNPHYVTAVLDPERAQQ